MSDQQGFYTLAEASQLTGLSTEALRLRIKRGKLLAERGNDGHPRVRLTSADLEDFRRKLDQQKPTLTRQDSNNANAIKVLETAVDALREQAGRERAALEAERDAARLAAAKAEGETAVLREALGRERERADRTEAAAAVVPELRKQLGRAEGESATLREQLKAERNRSVMQMREVEAARDAARADLAQWTTGSPFARALRAFLNRRGRP